MIQGSQEWIDARLGCVTASRISDVLAEGKGGKPSASRKNYIAELVTERLTGKAQDGFTSAAMQHGTDTEPQARAAYTLETGNPVEQVGFVPHPRIAMAGASPDGLIGAEGGWEGKSPNTATHIAYLQGASLPRSYLLQVQFNMACTRRLWWDWCSFDPRLPDEMQMHIRRIDRDMRLIAEIDREVEAVLAEVDQTVAALRKQFGVAA